MHKQSVLIDFKKYIILVHELLNNQINVDNYRGQIFKLFQAETGKMTEEEYNILHQLFYDADDSEDDPRVFPEFYIDEAELRKRAEVVLNKLEELEKKRGATA